MQIEFNANQQMINNPNVQVTFDSNTSNQLLMNPNMQVNY